MKPRQTSRNFQHGSNLPPHLPPPPPPPPFHQSALNQLPQSPLVGATHLQHHHNQQQQQLPPPQPSPHPNATLAGLPQSLRDIDFTKLGLNLDDLQSSMQASSNLSQTSAPAPSLGGGVGGGQDEIMKFLQAIYGKNSADILQKLPTLSDWPLQSVSPPDFPRIVGGSGGVSGGGGACGSNSLVSNCSVIVGGSGGGVGGDGGASGATSSSSASFSNNIINNNDSNSSLQQKQDIPQQFTNAQHPSSASAITHHFRVSTTNANNANSPQQQQQKSVLSLHHQHHHQHQNDSSNSRRLNHINLNTTNASFVNLNAATSNFDTNTSNSGLSALGGGVVGSSGSTSGGVSGKNLASYNINSTNSLASQVNPSNIMDNIGSSTMDNMFYDNSLQQQQHSKDTSSNQSSLIRHQQLQRLLKQAAGSHPKASSSSSAGSNVYSHKSTDSRNFNNNNMSQIHHQLTSPSSAITPPQQQQQQQHHQQQPTPSLPAVPKSLLNLAACSSSSPTSSNSVSANLPASSKLGQAFNLSQVNRPSSQQQQHTNLNACNSNIVSNNRTLTRNIGNTNTNFINGALNPKGPSCNSVDPTNLLQQINRSSIATSVPTSSSSGHPNRSSLRQQLQQSLLSEDQSQASSRNNLKQSSGPQSTNTIRPPNQQLAPRQQPPPSTNLQTQFEDVASKEAFLANLQERAARAGVSIGEISKSLQSAGVSTYSTTTNPPPAISQGIPTVQNIAQSSLSSSQPNNESCDRKEIESALSRVEARNDLSLLYPPMLLAPNSQRQINALSAGLHNSDDSELFTNEVRRIVLEECNIIYECKECNNLFRSLANLVKHKRSFCTEFNSYRANNLEMNRRVNLNAPSDDQRTTTTTTTTTTTRDSQPTLVTPLENANQINIDRYAAGSANVLANNEQANVDDHHDAQADQKYNLRVKRLQLDQQTVIPNDNFRALRLIRNHEKQRYRDQQPGGVSGGGIIEGSVPVPQTSLSKLLQSQPRNRLPVTRDSALMGALSMGPMTSQLVTSRQQQINNSNLQAAFNSDRGASTHLGDLNEHLVRNSSLAKTLLNEKVKSINETRHSSSSLLEPNNPPTQHIQSSSTMQQQQHQQQQSQATSSSKRVPKRKFLEDCIQKVKRDKIRTNVEGDVESDQVLDATRFSRSMDLRRSPTADKRQQSNENDSRAYIKDPLSVDESDADSDMLMIDLDHGLHSSSQSNTPNAKSSQQPQQSLLSKRPNTRRSSNTASSSASSTSSAKLNTSSALLKALTRPVDTNKSPYVAASSSASRMQAVVMDQSTTEAQSQLVVDDQRHGSGTVKPRPTDDRRQMDTDHHHDGRPTVISTDNSRDQVATDCDQRGSDENDQLVEPFSPLFDSYTCDLCNEILQDQAHLMSHTIERHKDMKMVYPCIFCSFSFITLENVCRHIIEIHKKPKAQVHRLREVVKSRAHISGDFLACSDYPPTATALTSDDKPQNITPKSVEPVPSVVVVGTAAGVDPAAPVAAAAASSSRSDDRLMLDSSEEASVDVVKSVIDQVATHSPHERRPSRTTSDVKTILPKLESNAASTSSRMSGPSSTRSSSPQYTSSENPPEDQPKLEQQHEDDYDDDIEMSNNELATSVDDDDEVDDDEYCERNDQADGDDDDDDADMINARGQVDNDELHPTQEHDAEDGEDEDYSDNANRTLHDDKYYGSRLVDSKSSETSPTRCSDTEAASLELRSEEDDDESSSENYNVADHEAGDEEVLAKGRGVGEDADGGGNDDDNDNDGLGPAEEANDDQDEEDDDEEEERDNDADEDDGDNEEEEEDDEDDEEDDEDDDDDDEDGDDDEDDDDDDDGDGVEQDDVVVKKSPAKSHTDSPSKRHGTPSSSSGGGGTSGASGGASGSGAGGGIMKLKIQLKTQPDEKSKVYRIV